MRPPKPRTSLSNCNISVSDQVYSGKALKPAVTVTLDGKTLARGTDYTVEYTDNTATVTVTGAGDYTGDAKAAFMINPKAVGGKTYRSAWSSAKKAQVK